MDLIAKGAKILCLSPHPDDTEFGLGATLSRFKGRYEGRIVVFSDRYKTRNEVNNEADQARSAKLLGFRKKDVMFVDKLGFDRLPIRFFGAEENRDVIRAIVSRLVKEIKPDIIFTPSLNETMQDHSALSEEVVRIVRNDTIILGYEVPKHNRFFNPNVFVDVSMKNVRDKIDALSCFSEFTTDYYFKGDVIQSLAKVRAIYAGYNGYAEGFELYRWKS